MPDPTQRIYALEQEVTKLGCAVQEAAEQATTLREAMWALFEALQQAAPGHPALVPAAELLTGEDACG